MSAHDKPNTRGRKPTSQERLDPTIYAYLHEHPGATAKEVHAAFPHERLGTIIFALDRLTRSSVRREVRYYVEPTCIHCDEIVELAPDQETLVHAWSGSFLCDPNEVDPIYGTTIATAQS